MSDLAWMDRFTDVSHPAIEAHKRWGYNIAGREWTFATNGQVFIGVRDVETFERYGGGETAEKLLAAATPPPTCDLAALREYAGPPWATVPCGACEGAGVITDEGYRYPCDCEGRSSLECRMDGVVCGVNLDRALLARAIEHLKGPVVSLWPSDVGHRLNRPDHVFVDDGLVRVIVMGVRVLSMGERDDLKVWPPANQGSAGKETP